MSKCVCLCKPLWRPIWHHVSSVILIISPTRHRWIICTPIFSYSPNYGYRVCLLCFLVVSYWWYWPLLVLSHPPVAMNETYHKTSWHLNTCRFLFFYMYFSGLIAQTGHKQECRDFPQLGARRNPWRWITVVDKGVATDEGWGPADSAVSLHKSWQGEKPLKTEPAHCLCSLETPKRIRSSEISV